jgi:hypothetical protein
MERMSAKEYLQGIKKLDSLINSLTEEYETMRSLALKVTASNDGERVQNSGDQDKMGNMVIRLIEQQEKINRNIDKYIDMRRSIHEVICTLDNGDHIALLYKRYFEYKSWEVIAYEMGYTYRWVTKLHGNALRELDNILDEKSKRVPKSS